MKKAMEENVTLKRKLHGLLKAQESVLSTMLKRSVRRKEALIAVLPLQTELPSDVVTISNHKIGEDTFGIISIGHKKTLDYFCEVKQGKHLSFQCHI